MDDLSDESIKEFKENVCDSAVIKFEQGCGPIETEVNVNAGDKISFSGGSASVGYRVKRDGVVGFVTAGHAANSVGKSIMYNGTTIASCEATQQSGNADAAFCAITIPTIRRPTHCLVQVIPYLPQSVNLVLERSSIRLV